jgi:ketosteroid isomerase-like protein
LRIYIDITTPLEELQVMTSVTITQPIAASFDALWDILLDKAVNLQKYIPSLQSVRILGRYGNVILREVNVSNLTFVEKITIDKPNRSFEFVLIGHPLFSGVTTNKVALPAEPGGPLMLTFALDWEPLNDQGRQMSQESLSETVQHALITVKRAAEKQSSLSFQTLLPGTMTGIVQRLFAAVEAKDVEAYAAFFSSNARYQVGNAPLVVGPKGIRELAAQVMQVVKNVTHNIKAVWEQGDTVICEMEVIYTRFDNKEFRFPRIDVIKVEDGQVQDFQAYIDANEVFS